MSGSINKVILLGRLGRDPEVRTFQNGGKVCNLSLATSQTWRDKATGERKERTEWHRIAIFNEKIAEIAERYLKKGALIAIEGQLETRKWTDQSGVEKYSTEVVLRPFNGSMTMVDTRTGGGGSGGHDADNEDDTSDYSGGGSGRTAQPPGGAYRSDVRGGRKSELDDDIPF